MLFKNYRERDKFSQFITQIKWQKSRLTPHVNLHIFAISNNVPLFNQVAHLLLTIALEPGEIQQLASLMWHFQQLEYLKAFPIVRNSLSTRSTNLGSVCDTVYFLMSS